MVTALLLVLAGSGVASAERLEPRDIGGGWQAWGPVYDPHSRSYFEMQYVNTRDIFRWQDAKDRAERLSYKGTPGRLAIVRNYDTHLFLLKTFRTQDPTWIGMSVDCKTMRAYWVDGTAVDQEEFNAWDIERWYRNDEINCEHGLSYMPAYYSPTSSYFRWLATGPAKSFPYIFVEYPTGEP